MNQEFRIVSVAMALLTVSQVLAHSGHGETLGRTWTDAPTHRTFDAIFVLERNGTVLLRDGDDQLVRTELDRLSDDDRNWVAQRTAGIRALNTVMAAAPSETTDASVVEGKPVPIPVRYFEPFVPHVSVRWDDAHLIVESDGMPDHPMMTGIRAWNQQVPLPQAYTGANAFRIPLHPKVAPQPTPAPFLNAIAVAVNGVPIFHPIKQDGRTDTLKNGELDEYGGHAGRADDYHYHLAPRHLEAIVGVGNPVAYSLDGYPIVVAKETDELPDVVLDENHGHLDDNGAYTYYATTAFPYLNISYRGEVDLDHRPRAIGVRPYTQPLRGATISGFEKTGDTSFQLTYVHGGETKMIDYSFAPDGGARFKFTAPDSEPTEETYGPPSARRREGKSGSRGPGDSGGPGRPSGQSGPSEDGPRQPWIVVHAAEIDTNQDGAVTREELLAEAAKAFDGYDRDQDGTLSAAELAGPSNVRSAMGGFIKGHAKDIDVDSNAGLARTELLGVATRMFEKMDADTNGTLSPEEIQAASHMTSREPRPRKGSRQQEKRRQNSDRKGA